MFVLGLSVTKFVHDELFFTGGNGTLDTIVNGTYGVFIKGLLSLGIIAYLLLYDIKIKKWIERQNSNRR